MDVAWLAWITQNNKYLVPWQYLKKEFSYEVDVLYADKHETFLQVDSIIFDGLGWQKLK